ncbi:MAG: sigma factor-like helix-turn-helix DNA-binding protein [Pseudomonas sp.]
MSTEVERIRLSHPDMLTGNEELESDCLATPAAMKRWIQKARKAARPHWLTQVRLGEQIGVKGHIVTRWEDLKLPDLPTQEQLRQICLACGLYEPDVEFQLPSELPAGASRASTRRPDYQPQPCSTLAQEIGEVAKMAASKAFPPNNQERNAAIFVARYAAGLSLQEVGDLHGFTRERVRQIQAKMLRYLGYGMEVPRRCFDVLRETLAMLQVEREDLLEDRLKPLLGDCSVRAAIDYGTEVLGETLAIELTTTRRGDVVAVQSGQGNWHDKALKLARRQIRVHGAAMVPMIWAYTVAEHGVAIAQDELVEFLKQSSGFAWLDEAQTNWFWFGPADNNRPVEIAKGILELAGTAVDIEDVYAGLVRQPHRTTSYASSFPELYPPPYVLQRVFAAHPDIECIQHDRLRLADGAAPGDAVSTVSASTVQALRALGGVASRGELREAVLDRDGHNPATFALALTSSPFIRRVGHGIYALRGPTLEPEHYARAMSSLEAALRTPVTAGADGSYSWAGVITHNMAANRVMSIPTGVGDLDHEPYLLGSGRTVTVSSTVRSERRLNRATSELLLMGLDVGDAYRVTIWPAERRCELARIDDTQSDAL